MSLLGARCLEIWISRREQDLECRPALPCPPGQLDAVNRAWHHDVGEQEVDRLIALNHLQRDVRIACLDGAIAQRLYLRDHGPAHHVVVVDHQNCFLLIAGHGLLSRHQCRCLDLHESSGAWKEYAEGRSLADLAGDLDLAFHLLDETIDHAEAKTGSPANLLGREERIEDSLQVLSSYDGAKVAHLPHRIASSLKSI